MEQGFQTSVDPAKRPLYRGVETVRQVLPSFFALAAARATAGPAPDQATQLSDALRVAYCQPAVGAFFNFELADEREPGRLAVRAALDRPDAEAVVRGPSRPPSGPSPPGGSTAHITPGCPRRRASRSGFTTTPEARRLPAR